MQVTLFEQEVLLMHYRPATSLDNCHDINESGIFSQVVSIGLNTSFFPKNGISGY
jgi:hypothetical protein